jgi:hypothetical protein
LGDGPEGYLKICKAVGVGIRCGSQTPGEKISGGQLAFANGYGGQADRRYRPLWVTGFSQGNERQRNQKKSLFS